MSSGNATDRGNLSLELWVNILSRLEDNVDPKFAWDCRTSLEDFAQMHSNIQMLRLVCTKWNTAFDDPQLSRSVFLRHDFENRNLPSLLQWLHRQRTSLRLFEVAAGSPVVEAALAALVCPGSQLALASIANISDAAVHVLPCHSGLHSINIEGANEEYADLTPLAALPYLGKLRIAHGSFECGEPLSQLTNLQLNNANFATTAADCFLKLSNLTLYSSHCEWHGSGLAGCHNLRELALRHCTVEGSLNTDHLRLRPGFAAHVPIGISALTQLTKLDVTIDGDSVDDMQFLWLASLASLKELGFHAIDEIELPAELSELTSLTKLWLSLRAASDPAACMEVHVNWKAMRSLKCLSIGPGLFVFYSNLLQVLGCTKLEMVCFESVRSDSHNAESAKHFGALIGLLALHRPDVECYLDQVQVSRMLWDCDNVAM